MPRLYKVIIYVPVDSADKIRKVLAESGAGRMGNYDSCSFSVRGMGRFRPLKGANPTIGEVGKLEEVEEERIEVEVEDYFLDKVIRDVTKAHPYEEPVIDIIEIGHWR